jgi:hypothetical protein
MAEECVSDILVYLLTRDIEYRFNSQETLTAKNIFVLIRRYTDDFNELYIHYLQHILNLSREYNMTVEDMFTSSICNEIIIDYKSVIPLIFSIEGDDHHENIELIIARFIRDTYTASILRNYFP